MRDVWLEQALAPPRAFGAPLGSGRLRVEPEDFVVEEDLGFAPSGAGVARAAEGAQAEREHGVGRPRAGTRARVPAGGCWICGPEGSPRRHRSVVHACRCRAARRLPTSRRCAERASKCSRRRRMRRSFRAARSPEIASRIRVRDRCGSTTHGSPSASRRSSARACRTTSARNASAATAPISARSRADLNAIHPRERTLRVLGRAQPHLQCSARRARNRRHLVSTLEPGDVANLDARGSVFPVEAVDDSLRERTAQLDLHPTGPMWGGDALLSRERSRELEAARRRRASPNRARWSSPRACVRSAAACDWPSASSAGSAKARTSFCASGSPKAASRPPCCASCSMQIALRRRERDRAASTCECT